MSTYATPMLEVPAMIQESGGTTLDLCFQCGTCSGTCPWNLVRNFRVRDVITRAQLGLEGYEGEDLWLCATCNACVDRCPQGVEIVDLVRTIRMIISETGAAPKTLRAVMGSVSSYGNPWSGDPAARQDWAKDLPKRKWDQAVEYAYFACCTQAYDPRNRKVAQAVAKVLDAAGVSWGLTDGREKCCGDAVRKGGAESMFQGLASHNVGVLGGMGATKVVVSSPHCLNTFRKEYPALGGKFGAVHVVEVLEQARVAGNLVLGTALNRKIVYHDPCYLGRLNGVYDAPRNLLAAVPGLTLMEFERNRAEALCCGGGGGRLWMETPVEERFAVLKLKEAVAKGADTVVTACPYCVSMFEDARTALNLDQVAVADVTEILAQAL
jgi:Fe-S oxidoreductase